MLWRKTFIHLISSISKRKKLSVSMRNQTSDLLIPGFKPLSLSQRGSLTRILLTATISNVENVICVNRQEKFTLFFITFWDSKFTIFLIWKVVWCWAILRSSMQSLLLKSYRPNTLYYGERSFAFAAPKLWNSIPEHIKSASSLTTFKTALKTYLFRRHFRDE